MPLLQILTNPQNFRFYAGGRGHVSNAASFGQKSIPYGNDTKGGGSSGQPYIQSPIPNELTTDSFDYFLRGGFLNNSQTSAQDVSRLTKMFIDLKSPNGLFFITKQNLLSNSAVRTQTSDVINEGIYSPLNTITQAGVISVGTHLNKQGLNPFTPTGAYADNDSLYYNKINQYNLDWLNSGGATALDNRLYALYESKILNNSIGGYAKLNNINVNLTDTILTYRGGPGSILGVGQTTIKFEDNGNKRTGTNNVQLRNIGFVTLSPSPAAGDYSVFKRPSGRTSNLFISPYGVSDAYETITNKLLPQGPNGAGVISKNGGYTFDPSFYNNIYQSGSLTPYTPLTGSETWTPKQDNPDSLKYIKDLSKKGVSSTYSKLTKTKLDNPYDESGEAGAYNWFNVYDPETTPGNTWPKNSDLIYANNTFTYNQSQIIKSDVNSPSGNHLSPKIQDFRKVLRNSLGKKSKKTASNLGTTPETPDYQTQNLNIRTNLGDPGQRSGKSYAFYSQGVQYVDGNGNPSGPVGPLDKINALPIYRSKEVDTKQPINDLVKFRIAAIDGSSPNFKTFMHFRAFIDSFSDSYSADWGSVKYLGRGEKFYNYNGFTRNLSLSFTVAAQSKPELIPMYKKLNYLASNLAPDYSPFGYMRGPLVQLTVGGYLYEQVGFISALTYDIPNDSPWEIGINEKGGSDTSVKELPHRINVSSFAFTPIHDFVPGKQGLDFNNQGLITRYGNERYIALSAGGSSNYNPTPPTANKPTPAEQADVGFNIQEAASAALNLDQFTQIPSNLA